MPISTVPAASSWNGRRHDHDRHQWREPDRSADHVAPADRGGRGTGAGAAAHRVQPDRARMRRPLGRRVRPQGTDAGAGRDRHARPRQLDGGVGQALHHPLPASHHEARRCLHHQRSLDGHRPSQRLRRHHALLQGRQDRRAVLLHQPFDGYRRHRLRTRRHRRLHGGLVHSDAQADRPGRRQRDADGCHPRQHAVADRYRRRHLFAGRLQRRRLPASGRDDAGIRHRDARPARRLHLRPLPRGGAGRDRQAAERHLAQRDDGRRLRRAGDA